LKISSKTKTDFDDLLLERSSFPLTVLLFFISLKIAIKSLSFSSLTLDNVIHSLINSAIAICVGVLIYVFVDLALSRVLFRVSGRGKNSAGESLASMMSGFLKVVIVILLFLFILYLWGVEIGPLLAGLGLAGLAVALAIQPTLANIFSGVAMILDKTVRVGDLVYLDANTKGYIHKIGLRSTKIQTFDNEFIIVPNTKLADSTIQNVALPEPKSRVVIPFSVGYGNDINKVKKVVLQEIKSIKEISNSLEPLVRFLEMGESSLNFKAYFYVDSYDRRFSAIDEANTKIYNRLRKEKIEIPFPQMDVHLKK
jgi:small-conductance mechanosensitive channel